MDIGIWRLVLLFVFVVLSAFFSSAETAFISLQRVRLRHMVESKVAGAALIAKIMERPEKFLSTVLLGNNLVNVATAALGTTLAVSLWGTERGLVIATVGVTALLLVFGEVTPKTIAAHHAERLALFYSRPVAWVSWVLAPFAAVLGRMSSGVLKLIGEPSSSTLVSEDEIRTLISVGEKDGAVEETEAEMLHNVFEFGDRPVKEVMTPRPEILWVEQGTTLKDFLSVYSQEPHTRFPTFRETQDQVVGFISIKDVLMAQAQGSLSLETPIDELIRPLHFVPETKPIGDLFAEMRQRNLQMAVIVDEYGGTAGIVTLESLVEEIVGRMGDELAVAVEEFRAVDEHTFQVDGSMRVEEANEEMNLGLPPGDYETVAGLVLRLLGHIPREGERIRYQDLKLVVTQMKGLKIEKVLVSKETDGAPAR